MSKAKEVNEKETKLLKDIRKAINADIQQKSSAEQVFMYVSKSCADCDKAKALLKEKNISFEALEIEAMEKAHGNSGKFK